jgi:hypothetical protein
MSTLTVTSPVQATSGYASNVGQAARALVRALFAVAPRAATDDSHVTAGDLHNLYCMANRCESVLPNLAQELRIIAARSY